MYHSKMRLLLFGTSENVLGKRSDVNYYISNINMVNNQSAESEICKIYVSTCTVWIITPMSLWKDPRQGALQHLYPGQKEVRASIKARTSFVLILYLRRGAPHYYAAGTCTSKEARTFSVLFQLLSTGSMYLYRGAHLPGQKRYAPLWRYIPMLYLSDFC